ncbi:NADase-type glycan-binding domain-containing protein [Actinosynnema sp. CS-041913]|uniref:NADase-type glycan-binding domain-containing protein n=1 Tax=Actinosynnema sp. CS-041913 TaxID=3239917 RepID=UPI003D8A1643
MQPTDERQAPPGHKPRLTERRVPQAGDLICGQCGEANAPTRRFCARCGHELVEAQVVKEKWWRRIFPRREPAKAGTRHRRRGSPGRVIGRVVRWALAILLLAGVGLYGLYSPFRQAVNDQATSATREVKDWFSNDPKPVRPSAITATAESPGHAAGLAADNVKSTYWAAPVEPELPALVLNFDRPVDVKRAIFQIGIGDKFQTAHRPEKVHLVYSTGRTFDLTLADTPDAQPVKIEHSEGAESVEVFVKSLHRSLQGNEVAISEIEFFTVE